MTEQSPTPPASPPSDGPKPLTAEEQQQLEALAARQAAIDAAVVEQERADRLAVFRSFVASTEFAEFETALGGFDQVPIPTEVAGHMGAIRSGMRNLKNNLTRNA